MPKFADWLSFRNVDWQKLKVDEEYEEMLTDAYIEEWMIRKHEVDW